MNVGDGQCAVPAIMNAGVFGKCRGNPCGRPKSDVPEQDRREHDPITHPVGGDEGIVPYSSSRECVEPSGCGVF